MTKHAAPMTVDAKQYLSEQLDMMLLMLEAGRGDVANACLGYLHNGIQALADDVQIEIR